MYKETIFSIPPPTGQYSSTYQSQGHNFVPDSRTSSVIARLGTPSHCTYTGTYSFRQALYLDC
ncbi:hypothetical protein J2X31_003712 [Flavobacterium arsenatis]|uniref:Uncharacterized protein n=1 Tax=Flavobacterium arsenatis TaxID=1484332 RepID=A0ABU1TUY2_9FLAO|nr:hypothetical protein [Flavobacterium arsenatis]